MVLLSDAVLSRCGALLLKLLAHGAVDLFFKDGIRLDRLELGLEVLHVVRRRVASAAGIGHVGPNVFNLITSSSPIALAAAALLGLGRVGISMAGFGKVLGQSRFTLSSAVGNAGVVTVSELVRASHG